MIEVEEHWYIDDPADGHPDVRTRLRDAAYFFLGNGLISAAVQWAPAGEGTPLGLLISDPERLGPKRAALTMDPIHGLEPTCLQITASGSDEPVECGPVGDEPAAGGPGAGSVTVGWGATDGIGVVVARWRAGGLTVEELFSCPDPRVPLLVRSVSIGDEAECERRLNLRTAAGASGLEERLHLPAGGSVELTLAYTLEADDGVVRLTRIDPLPMEDGTGESRDRTARIRTGSEPLDCFFAASTCQLPAVVSRTGVVDASIWQYNREWVRDHSAMAVGLTLAGHHAIAGRLLERLLTEFVSAAGDTVDSSRRRPPDEVELDQNGELLQALATWTLWTGESDLIARHWERIERIADYPFRDPFFHDPPGLLANRREYWERHAAFGIETGFELSYQIWNVVGLRSAALMARTLGRPETAVRWERRAGRLLRAVLEDPVYALHDGRGFIKRRGLDGAVQETITPDPAFELPPGVGLGRPGSHPLNPDTSAALPIALELIDPASPIAAATMHSLEELWNQDWTGGGYARYHIASEADQPGSWPFPSLFVARAALERGEYDKVERILAWLETVPGAAAGSWFENYGERVSPPYPQVGVPPWTWAEIIVLSVHHLLGVRPGPEGLTIRPRLLPGESGAGARLHLRGHTVELYLERDAPAGGGIGCDTSARILHRGTGEVLLAYPEEDIAVTLHLPRSR